MTLAKFNPLFAEFGLAPLAAADWTPAVDILEAENEITIKAELPGIDPKNITVNVDNNVLTLKGERRFEKEEKKENFHRVERTYGTFSRTFALPTFIDPATVRADYKDGVLKILLAKKETAKARNIEVKAA
jgi:HSP20 family protein